MTRPIEVHPQEEPTGGWLRVLGAMLAVAAGVLHLAQIGVHLEEGWPVAGFFATTGVAQVGVGAWLLRPRRRAWLRATMVGSAGVIAVWIVSRTIGLPFVEGGEPEPVGIADAFASLLEALTIVALGIQLLGQRGQLPDLARGAAAVCALGLVTVWQFGARAGAFEADDARLALDRPQLLDWLVLAFGVDVAAILLVLRRAPLGAVLGGLLVSSALFAAVGVVMTLPPTIGQNVECEYAPLSTVTGSGHAEAPEPVAIAPGERRLLPVFELRACGRDAVEVIGAQPLTVDGSGPEIVGFWLLPPGMQIDDAGVAEPASGAVAVPPGSVLPGGKGRQLAVVVRGSDPGELRLASVRITYRTSAGQAAFGFATTVTACVGTGCESPPNE
ncbi:MAG: hypothetical protein ACRDFZ_02470 [Candidatus Limnocylindria bacterium]